MAFDGCGKVTRRTFMGTIPAAAMALTAGCGDNGPVDVTATRRPNVLIILTDDQGYGDVGFHGNDMLNTPNMDRLAAGNVEFTRFYVCPVCAPTRAGLLTGRYHHRTGVLGVMSGEAFMDPEEVTLAEMFDGAGYRTGIFGKWHLGDTYPRRPVDQGFREAVVHNGGGLSQPSCPPGVGYGPEQREKHGYVLPEEFPHWVSSNSYWDPVLSHNGVLEQYRGYCTDIFVDEAMRFMDADPERPFFVYLPLNAPHAPEMVAEDYLTRYRGRGLRDRDARGYAMIENIDDNLGRILEHLDRTGLADDTIIVFLGDNGPQYDRYTAGLRGRKGSFYEGGIRVPFVIRAPGIDTPRTVDVMAANIDICPTLLELCGVTPPADVRIDGVSFVPLMRGDDAPRPERTLFFQGNSGVPEPYNRCAVMTGRYKLVDGRELYDLIDDRGETTDIADGHPEVVADLRRRYEAWYDDVIGTGPVEPRRIWVGDPHENPVVLTPQDWRGPRSRFVRTDALGHWLIDVRRAGRYRAVITHEPDTPDGRLRFSVGGVSFEETVPARTATSDVGPFELAPGPARLDAFVTSAGDSLGVRYVRLERLD